MDEQTDGAVVLVIMFYGGIRVWKENFLCSNFGSH